MRGVFNRLLQRQTNPNIHVSVQTKIRIFGYFPPNIDIRIQFMVILKAEYYLNIQIFCQYISEYWSLKIRGNAGIKEVYFHF